MTCADADAVAKLLAEALFCSDVQESDRLNPDTIRAKAEAVAFHVGEARCAELVAQEFGEHPECAAWRMQWAIAACKRAFEFEPAGSDRPARASAAITQGR